MEVELSKKHSFKSPLDAYLTMFKDMVYGLNNNWSLLSSGVPLTMYKKCLEYLAKTKLKTRKQVDKVLDVLNEAKKNAIEMQGDLIDKAIKQFKATNDTFFGDSEKTEK